MCPCRAGCTKRAPRGGLTARVSRVSRGGLPRGGTAAGSSAPARGSRCITHAPLPATVVVARGETRATLLLAVMLLVATLAAHLLPWQLRCSPCCPVVVPSSAPRPRGALRPGSGLSMTRARVPSAAPRRGAELPPRRARPFVPGARRRPRRPRPRPRLLAPARGRAGEAVSAALACDAARRGGLRRGVGLGIFTPSECSNTGRRPCRPEI